MYQCHCYQTIFLPYMSTLPGNCIAIVIKAVRHFVEMLVVFYTSILNIN